MSASKVFRDSVHGLIELPHSCIRIIDTVEFQRLRRIKQLSICDFVFPNASHTRWEHSLGVAHVAGRVLTSIQTKQPELGISAMDIEMIQLAGLVHDLGHSPFSHTFERVNSQFNHEQNGLGIWNRLVTKLDISADVANFVRGCFSPELRSPHRKWMYQLINNTDGGIDCDRLDYCKRDAQIASVKIGFDMDRLIFGWTITKDGEFQFNSKLVGDVFAVHRARFLLFDTIYNHKVVKAIDLMMVDILTLLLPDIDPQRDGDDIIYHFSKSREPRHVKANALLERILRRDLYKQTQDKSKADVTCTVIAHYGAGNENPLKRTRFSRPLDESLVNCLCPSTFQTKQTWHFITKTDVPENPDKLNDDALLEKQYREFITSTIRVNGGRMLLEILVPAIQANFSTSFEKVILAKVFVDILDSKISLITGKEYASLKESS